MPSGLNWGDSLWVLADLPPLRWHFLSDDVRIAFDDPGQNRVTFSETIDMRAMRRWCDSLHIHPIRGDLKILSVSQDGELLRPKTEGKAGPGYLLKRLGKESAALVVDLRERINFGRKTVLVLQWELKGGEASRMDEYFYTVNTIVDHLSITVCFHRNQYPNRITASSIFGIREESFDFHYQRRADDQDHICESWSPQSVKYQHTYVLRWPW